MSEGSVYALVDVAQQAATLLTLPVFFFFLSVEDFGVITLALVVSQITMFASTMGLDFTLLRLYFTWPEQDRSELATGILYLSILWSFIWGILSLIVIGNLELETRQLQVLIVGALSGVLLGLKNIPLAIVRVSGEMRTYASAEMSAAVSRAVLQLAFVIAGLGALGYLIGYALAPTISAVVLLTSRRVTLDWGRPRWLLQRDIWAYALKVLPSLAFNRFVAVADRLILFRWSTFDALGIYGAASRFSACLKLLTGGFKMAVAPALSRAEADQTSSSRVFFGLSRLLLLMMLSVGSALMLAVWFIQFTPWSAHWLQIQRLVAVLVFAQFLTGFGLLWQTGFYYSPRPEGASVGVVASAIALLLGLFILVPRFGIMGAAIAQVLGGAVNILVLAVIEARETGHLRSWHELMALTALFVPTVLCMWVVDPRYQIYVLIPTFLLYGFVTAATMWRLWQPRPA